VAAPTAPTAESREQLLALIRGFRVSQAIYVATRLGIPDLLAEGPRAIGDLAEAAGAHTTSLGRLLMFLASVGVLDKVGPDRFTLTPIAAALRKDVPGSVRSSVLFQLDDSHWRPWGNLLHSVRTGETAFNHVHGKGLFDYLAQNPEVSALFNQGMLGNSPAHAQLIARNYDFAGMKTVIDVGGGRGRLIAEILAEHPHLKGVLFDQPHVLPDARTLIGEAGVAQRCEFVGGDFFKNVPAGGDAYILRNIIHDWQDEEAVTILAACRRAMTDGARLVLVERQLPDDPGAAPPVFLADLEMLVNVGGRERTTEEYAALFERSGLELARTVSLGSSKDAMGHCLVEARPV
jgi:O-methyltransferase/methyltransferase family protein